MEKKNQTAAPAEQEQDLVAKAKANKKTITGLSIAVIVIIIAVLAGYFICQSGSRKADEAIGRADIEQNDSIALDLYREAAKAGYSSGNRAKAEVGIRLYEEGNYEEAAQYLSDCSLGDNVAAAGVKILEGDCYVNLEQYDKAIRAYNQAISKADHNPRIVPFILVKKAHVFRAQQEYAKEADAYKEIIDDYPQFTAGQTDLRALYERAHAAAAH